MNERIEKLAEQADLYARSDNSSMVFENYQKRYTEKFTELIINECAKQLDVYKMMKLESVFYSNLIREHFGVKR